jgi:hypothetical protein
MVVSNPMPTARTSTRRLQYVACEIVAGRGRAPRDGPGLARRFWSIPVTMEDSRRMSLKARRKEGSSTQTPPRSPAPRGRGRPSGEPAVRRASAHLPTVPAPGGNGGWEHLSRALQFNPQAFGCRGGAVPLRAQFGW